MRVTTTLDSGLKRLLDAQVQERGITRSEAVEEAVAEWVARRTEGDLEESFGYGARMDANTERLAALIVESRISSDMALEALREGSASVRQIPYEELRRRATARRRSR